GNVLLSRELLTAAGPFRADFRRAEDIELALRLRRAGAHFVFTESAIGWHYARRPLGSWLALPRQYAEYDHRLAELHPEVAILTLVQRELGRRHPLTRRVAGLLERVPVLRAATVGAGVTAALGLDFVRAHALASRSLSLVYDLEYRAAFGSAARCAPSAGTPRDASA
ncbi:MAG: hypothetical protein M0R74_07670, partial [Dehalococcoidia bacterium]|nr:hypothetical protein [Dehalococcoidia bacterium]